MTCTIATRVNRGEFDSKVSRFGSKLLTEHVTESINKKSFKASMGVWSERRLAKLPQVDKAISYVFSNSATPTIKGLKALGKYSEEELDILDKSGANLPKGLASEIFTSMPDRQLSTTPNLGNILIVEGAKPEDTDTRKFVHIGKNELVLAEILASDEVENTAEDLKATKETINDSIEFFVISALYRGFDISFDSSIDAEIIKRAKRKFKYYIGKNSTANIRHVSTLRRDINVQKVSDMDAFIKNVDVANASKDMMPTTDDSNLFLASFLSKGERRHFNTFKRANTAAKVVVAKRVSNIFKKMIPGLTIEYLTSSEISGRFGKSFEGKKGFNINNLLVINIDRFSSATMFHEFGHFYVAWLKNYDANAHSALLGVVRKEYGHKIKATTKAYTEKTSFAMSEESILEELFVEELGLKAVNSLDNAIDAALEADSEVDLDETVDAFSLDFLQTMTRRISIRLSDTVLTLDSSIGDIYNIATSFSTSARRSMLTDNVNNEEMNSLAEFFVEKATPRQVFDALIARGLIRYSSAGKVILLDTHGNRYDKKGEINENASYDFVSWEADDSNIANEKLIESLEPYLSMFSNDAVVSYRIDSPPIENAKLVKEKSEGIVLSKDEKTYIINKQHVSRASTFTEEEFINEKPTDAFINARIYSLKVEAYTAHYVGQGMDADTAEDLAINTAAEFMVGKQEGYQDMYDEIEEMFIFKTNEGTFAHALNEFFFLALNASNSLKYKGKKRTDLTYDHFAKEIIKHVGRMHTEKSVKYFRNVFFNPMIDAGLAHTPEYKRFEELYNDLVEATVDRDMSNVTDLLNLTRTTILREINKLQGPLVIMPEVRVGNVKRGVAGTIDLLVFDGKGVAHIFDYKNKQSGKKSHWAYPSSVRMNNELEAYSENAMMRASVQLSQYKLYLGDLGIEVGSMKIFYINNDLEDGGNDPEVLNESLETALSDTLKYVPVSIDVENIMDVSAELTAAFKRKGITGIDIEISSDTADIKTAVQAFSGGVDIDSVEDIDVKAARIFEAAMKEKEIKQSRYEKKDAKLEKLLQIMGTGAKMAKGLRVRLSGNSYVTLDGGLKSKTAAIAAIKRLLKNRQDVKSVEEKVFLIFNGLNRDSNTSKKVGSVYKSAERTIRGLLKHTDPTTHDLTKASSNHSLGVEYSGILYAKNRMTGHTRILVVNADNNETLGFGGRNNYSIYGNYITNYEFKAREQSTPWKNTTKHMRLIKTGLHIIMEKQKNPSFVVSEILTNDPLSLGSIPELIDVPTVLRMTENMIKIAVKNGEVLPASITSLLDNPRLFDANTYGHDPVQALLNFMTFSTGNLIRTEELFSKGKTKQETKAKLRNLLENYDSNSPGTQEMIAALIKYRAALEQDVYTTRQDRVNSDHYRATDQLLMFLRNVAGQVKIKEMGQVTHLFMPTNKGANYHSAALSRGIGDNMQLARVMQSEFKHESNVMLNKLLKDSGIEVSMLGAAAVKHSMKEVFNELYTTDNTDRRTAYILKSYKDPSLRPAQREYLEWVNKTLLKYAAIGKPDSRVVMPDGFLPLVGRSRQSMGGGIKRVTEGFLSLISSTQLKEEEGVDELFMVEGKYNSQFLGETSEGTAKNQYNSVRRRMLGLDTVMADTANAVNIRLDRYEDNIENVLDAVVETAVKQIIFKQDSELTKAFYNEAERQESLTDKGLGMFKSSINISQKRNVVGTSDSAGGGVVSYLNRMVTKMVLPFSIAQAMLESISNPMMTTSLFSQDKLFNLIKPPENRIGIQKRYFGWKSYVRAVKLLASLDKGTEDLITAMDILYGITIYDVDDVNKKFNILEGSNVLNTNALMVANRRPLDYYMRLTFIAHMIERGSFDAHRLATDGSNKLIYDEDKDLHYKLRSGDDASMKLLKKKLYASSKSELAKEINGLTGKHTDAYADRKMSKALTRFEANRLKEMLVETYSSLDATSRSNASSYILFAPFLKMKTFLIAKMPRYFQAHITAAENQSTAYQVKVPDESAPGGYRIEYVSMSSEGIFYSIGAAIRLLWVKKGAIEKGDFTSQQYQNFIKLATDVSLTLIFTMLGSGIFSLLDDDDDEAMDPLLELFKARYEMATYDVFFLLSLGSSIGGDSSMSVTASVIFNTVNSLKNLMVASIGLGEDDFDGDDYRDLLFDLAGKTHGVGKTINVGYKEYNHYQE